MRGFHCGQKLTLHKQAGYICADRLFQSQESACKRAADHTIPTASTTEYMSSRVPRPKSSPPQGACNGCLRSTTTHVPVHSRTLRAAGREPGIGRAGADLSGSGGIVPWRNLHTQWRRLRTAPDCRNLNLELCAALKSAWLPAAAVPMNKHFRVAGRLALRLEELGIRVSAVLRRAGLPQDLFEQTRVLVTTEELFALWRAIGEVSTDPAIGLKLGTETRTERFHPSGIAALSTENFGAAIDHIARYKQLTCPEEMLQDTHDAEWCIRFRWLLAVDSEPQVLIEYCFAWLLTIARHGSREDHYSRKSLSRASRSNDRSLAWLAPMSRRTLQQYSGEKMHDNSDRKGIIVYFVATQRHRRRSWNELPGKGGAQPCPVRF